MSTNDTLLETAFTVDALRSAAERKAGCSDYGSDSYMPGLEALLYSIEHEAHLNQIGQVEMARRIVDALANRLTVVAWEKANPELASAAVRSPLIIIGLPRTGSSILHETLASAPDNRTPLIWEVRDFSLVYKVQNSHSDARVQNIDAAIESKKEIAPGYAAMHFEGAHIPMECAALTVLDISSVLFWSIARTPTYCRFLLSHDARTAYHWHKRALRYLQASQPEKRWVLKAPMHSAFLDVLLETYPDAMIIQTHRDPRSVIGSMCSLHATLRKPWTDALDVEAQAAFDASFAAQIIQRAVTFRQNHPEAEARICDVAFKEFMADQEATLANIYRYFGLDFSAAARDAMVGYLQSRPREKYGKHDYSLAQFGLTPDKVAELFSAYNRQYGNHF